MRSRERVIFCRFTAVLILSTFGIISAGNAFASAGTDSLRTKGPVSVGGRDEIKDSLTSGDGGNSEMGDFEVIPFAQLRDSAEENGLKSGFYAVDFNVSPKLGEKTTTGSREDKTDYTRVINATDLLEKIVLEMPGRDVFIFSHMGDPREDLKAQFFSDQSSWRGKEKYSLDLAYDKAVSLLEERGLKQGRDFVFVKLPSPEITGGKFNDNFAAAKQVVDETRRQYAGTKVKIIFGLPNVRFFDEKADDTALREKFAREYIIGLTGYSEEQLYLIGEMFAKAHRGEEGSMLLFNIIPKQNRAGGIQLEREVNTMLQVESRVTGSFSALFSGMKFKKWGEIGTLAKRIERSGGSLWLGGALYNEWGGEVEAREMGRSLRAGDKDSKKVRKGIEKVQAAGLQPKVPTDFTLDGKPGSHGTIGKDDIQVDFGEESTRALESFIEGLKAGDLWFVNGGIGIVDKEGNASAATKRMFLKSSEAAERGVIVYIVGGDILAQFNNFNKELISKGQAPLSSKIYVSEGGGVVAKGMAEGDIRKLGPVDAVVQKKSGMNDGGVFGDVITILANNTTLVEAPNRTGHKSIRSAGYDGAQGYLLNHSEYRADLEVPLGLMVKYISGIQPETVPPDEIEKIWLEAVEATGASAAQARTTLDILNKYRADSALRNSTDAARNKKDVDPELEQEIVTRRLVNRIINIQLKAIVALNNATHSVKKVEICVGATRAQDDAGRTMDVIKQDVEEITQGVSVQELKSIGARFAMEPRYLIGQTNPVIKLSKMSASHKLIKDTVGGKDFMVSYGGGSNSKNAEELLSQPDIDGLLIGGAALKPDEIGRIIDTAAKVSEETGKRINIGLNWKSADQKSGFGAKISDFAAMFDSKIESGALGGKVTVTISTNQVYAVVSELRAALNGWDLSPAELKTLALELKVTPETAEVLYREMRRADKIAFDAVGGRSFKELVSWIAGKKAGLVIPRQTVFVSSELLLPKGDARQQPAAAGFFTAVDVLSAQLKGDIQIVVYGAGAERFVRYIPDAEKKNVSSISDLNAFISEPGNKNILPNSIIITAPGEENTPAMKAAEKLNVRRMVGSPVITLSFAKVLRETFGNIKDISSQVWFFVNALGWDFGLIPVDTLKTETVRKAVDERVIPDALFDGLGGVKIELSEKTQKAVDLCRNALLKVGA